MDEKKNNKYIITEFLHLPIIRDIKPIVRLFVYFIPYHYSVANDANEDLIEEQEKKRKYIEGSPRFRNVQQQGFGNIALREKDISFSYFYNRLCSFEENYSPESLESDGLRDALRALIGISDLYMKVNHKIPGNIEKKVIEELDGKEVKYVMAKLLLYVVRGDEQRWPSDDECREEYTQDIRKKFTQEVFLPNIHMGFRKDIDEPLEKIFDRLSKADCIQFLCHCASTFLGGEDVSRAYQNRAKEYFSGLIQNGDESVGPDIDIILSGEKENTRQDTILYKMYPTQERMAKNEIICYCRDELRKMKQLWEKQGCGNKLIIRQTNVVLPYALMLAKHRDSEQDYLKLDLYSPGIMDNRFRPSTYIFRESQKELFEHFDNVFKNLWGNEQLSEPFL